MILPKPGHPGVHAIARRLRAACGNAPPPGVLLAVFALVLGATRASAEDFPVLTHPDEIWALPTAQKQSVHPLRMEGRVNYYDPYYRLFWLEQNGVSGYLQIARDCPDMQTGQYVRIEGTIVPSEGLRRDEVTVTVLEAYRPVEPIDSTGLLSQPETLTGLIVTGEGYVDNQQEIDGEHWRLTVIIDGRPVICWVRTDDLTEIPTWQGNLVRATGLYSSRLDPSQTNSLVEFWISDPANLEILGPLSDSPAFKGSVTTIDQLATLSPGSRVLLEGVVQQQSIGSFIILRDATGQVCVETVHIERMPHGTRVKVLGEIGVRGPEIRLRNGLALVLDSPNPATASHPSAPREEKPLATVEQIRQLSIEEAAAGVPVDIEGMVTWSADGSEFFFLQDIGGGVRILHDKDFLATPPLAKYLRVIGRTVAYGLAPAVELTDYVDLGAMNPPSAEPVSFDQAITGREDGRWVEMQGYLRHVEQDGNRRWIYVTTPSGEIVATIEAPVLDVAPPGSLLRIHGVCETIVDDSGRVEGIMLRVPFIHDIFLDEAAPTDLFALPQRPISALRQLRAVHELSRAHIQGTVLHQVPGRFVTIQERDDVLTLYSSETQKVRPGEIIDAVGIVGSEGLRIVLREAIWKTIGERKPPDPITIANPDRIEVSLDGRLVRLRGVLLDSLERPDNTRLTIQEGKTVFEAFLDHPAGVPDGLPRPGAVLELTGLYQIDFDDTNEIRGFQLRLRSIGDLDIVRPARLWTVRRALTVAGILGGIALLGLGWVTALRRRVKIQTEQIRTQLEKELALEQRYRSIVENANDFIFTADLKGGFTEFNPAGERMTGFSRNQARKMSLADLFGQAQDSVARLITEANAGHPFTVTFQAPLTCQDGRSIWVETSARPHGDPLRPDGILGIVRDISDRKKIEEELKRARDAAEANTRAKSQFLANMSHEIRTPMNAVIGMADLLLETPLDDSQQEFAETIRTGTEALLTILNDILDFSKIEAGQLKFEILDFDLRETVEGMMELLAPKAAAKGLELTVQLPPDLPRGLRGDSSRLRQVLLNFVGNAIKFTTQGEVALRVSKVSGEADSTRLRFEVIDTGIGLQPDAIPLLFKPFSQADTSTTRRFGGTGLGLAICRQIVELKGGTCGVESTYGQGSIFWCEIPFPHSSEPLPEEDFVPHLRELAHNRHALYCEQNNRVAEVLESYARTWGLNLHRVQTVSEAVEALQAPRSTIELLLVSNHLPHRDGLTFIDQLRDRVSISSLGIVLLTSMDGANEEGELERRKIAARVLKPVRYRALGLALIRALEVSSHRGDLPNRPGTPRAGLLAQLGAIQPPTRQALGKHGSLRILLAEDNLVNQRVATLQLNSLGHVCHCAADGHEVLELLERSSYDIILMDCQMPELDGFETTRIIRERRPGRFLPIVALTASAMKGDREKCLAAGMDDYLSKPIRLPDLAAAIDRCLSRRPEPVEIPPDDRPSAN